MTENVYVIKVRTRPPLSSLYPSERRYSASTIGGLSMVHFGLGVLSLLLGTLALSLQGPVLSVACLVPFATGLLAWRRWYIDRNIATFFYGSLFSLAIASLCFVVTIFDIAAASGGSAWPLARILDAPRHSAPAAENSTGGASQSADGTPASSRENPFNVTDDRGAPRFGESSGSIVGLILSGELNESDLLHSNAGNDDLQAEASFALEERTMTSEEMTFQDEGGMNITRESVDLTKEKAGSFWRNRYEDTSHARTLLTLNVLVASLLEAFWSLLSAKIAFRGMTNRLSESNNVVVVGPKTTRLPPQKRKPPAPKPDILDHDRRLSESLQNLASLQGLAGPPGPRLPLPESSREFRERVEKFLANQATHRVVEGA